MSWKKDRDLDMKCIICGSGKFSIVSDGVRDSVNHKVARCNSCFLVQLSPVPSLKEEKYFYDKDKQAGSLHKVFDIDGIKKNAKADTTRRADLVAGLVDKKSSIADIGSGYGFFINEMRRRGFNATGLEGSEERVSISRDLTPAKVIHLNLYSDYSDIGVFDCLVLFQVLEHMREPVKILKTLKKHLKPGAKLVIEVPNFNDHMLKTNKAYRNFYWQKAHVSYFNSCVLAKVLRKAGFQKYTIQFEQRYGIENFMHWVVEKKPQIRHPSFSSHSYEWLEEFYKRHLRSCGRSDTLIAVTSR